jgi:hypothetical protein
MTSAGAQAIGHALLRHSRHEYRVFRVPARLLRGPGDPPLGRRDVPVFLRDLPRQPGAGGDPGRARTDASERGCLVHRAAGDRDDRGLSLARIPKAHDGAPRGIREIVESTGPVQHNSATRLTPDRVGRRL